MKYYKYSFKCKKCGLVVYSPRLSGDYTDECDKCESKEFKRRYLADFLRLLKYLFTNATEWIIDKIKQFFLPAAIILLVLFLFFGIPYIAYSFNKNECTRVHNLGYETDFDFYGGCYVKVNGRWMPFENMRVNVITEGE